MDKKNNKGFTLIEILIAMVIMVILGGALLGLQYILSQNRTVAVSNYLSVNSANNSISSMIREIRGTRASETGAYPIESASNNNLVFFSDIDFDGETERVRYTLTDNSLEKGVIEPTGVPSSYPPINEKIKVLSSDVRNEGSPLFTYYNEDWPNDTENNPLSIPPALSSIKLIKVYLKIRIDNDPTNDYVLESFANIRMLKNNL